MNLMEAPMDQTVRERLARIREMAAHVEEEAGRAKWDSALARAVTLNYDAAFIVDWLRSQAEYHFSASPPAGADTWEPPAEAPLGNVSEPLSGTPDADLPVAR
jgi:hypothetical protein